MALTSKGLLSELSSELGGLRLSTNSAIDDIVSGHAPAKGAHAGLNRTIDDAVKKIARLRGKGREADVRALIEERRAQPAKPVVIGQISNMDAQLEQMEAMIKEIDAGGALDPKLAEESEAEQIRYYCVKDAIDRRRRFHLILDEIVRRAGL